MSLMDEIGHGLSGMEMLRKMMADDLRPGMGRVLDMGTIMSIGRRTEFIQARLIEGAARVCASATSTALLLRPEAAGDGN